METDCKNGNKAKVSWLAKSLDAVGDCVDLAKLREFMLFTDVLDKSRGQVFKEVNPELLVGQVESSVTLRATVRVRIKACFAGNGRSLGKKRNTESRSHSGSRRAAPQASWAVLQSLERACHSLRTAPCPQCLWRG